MRRRIAAVTLLAAFALSAPATAQAACDRWTGCDGQAEVGVGRGDLTAAYVEQTPGGGRVASNTAPAEHPYTYQLSHPCVVDDRQNGACRGTDFRECPAAPGRVVEDLVSERRRLVITKPPAPGDPPGPVKTTVDGFNAFDPTTPVGTPVGPWIPDGRGCTDITALNPPPSAAEVFRYFRTLPLPQLTAEHQPPGNGLSGLPVIFYTDSPTIQTFTVTIRGFTVDIAAAATAFTWHTGDGAHLTTTDPGAPYPHQTVTHGYRSGTYTAYLTTTWGATFSVNGGAAVAVPGTTTTDGPPVTFAVLQARAVLTNPYD
jgi:hypothetical protein